MTRWHDGLGPAAWIAMAFVILVFWTLVDIDADDYAQRHDLLRSSN
jgi:hypothetical protein